MAQSPNSQADMEETLEKRTLSPPTKLPDRSMLAGIVPTTGTAPVPRLEGYHIVGKLGAGGMGTVWKAWQLSTRREVALKLLNFGDTASERAKQRFDREVEVTSRLQHPNIARIYDSGIHHGVYYYAMELIEGVPLDAYVRERRLSRRQTLHLMAVVCQAVQHAHQRGVIHRDIKPSNVLVDAEGQPHLVDFGLGKYLNIDPPSQHSRGSSSSEHAITVQGEWAGTPAYMSPEQAAGHVHLLDTRSDVYSLGVVLYQLLTGRLPHDTRGTQVEVIRRIIDTDIARPRAVSKDLDRELEALLLKALAKKPDDRYASAGAMAEDIQNYLRGEPLGARQPTAFYFLRRKLRKHRIPVTAAALVLLTIIGMSIHASLKIKVQRDIAQAAAHSERELRKLAEMRYAESLILWADALSDAGNWDEARARYWQAFDLQRQHQLSPIAAALGLIGTYHRVPPPLVQLPAPPAAQQDARMRQAWTDIHSDGRQVFLLTESGTFFVGDLVTGRLVHQIELPDALLHRSRVAGNSNSISCITETPGGQVTFAELSFSGQVLRSIPLSSSPRDVSVFSPSGRYVALTYILQPGTDEEPHPPLLLVVHDLESPESPLMSVRLPPEEFIYSSAMIGEAQQLFTWGRNGMALWDVKQGKRIRTYQTIGPMIGPPIGRSMLMAAASDGSTLLMATDRGKVILFDLHTGDARELGEVTEPPSMTAFSHDGKYCAVSDSRGIVRVWRVSSGKLVQMLEARPDTQIGIAFSTDGRLILARDPSGHVWAWNIDPDEHLPVVSRHDDIISAIAVSPDGRLAAVGHRDCTLLINDITTGHTLLQYRLDWPVAAVKFPQKGSGTILVADDQGGIYHLDLLTPSLEYRFEQVRPRRIGDAPRVSKLNPGSIALWADGHRSIHASIKGSTLWDTSTGQRLRLLDPRPARVGAFSGDGSAALLGVVQVKNILACVPLGEGEPWQLDMEDHCGIITALAGTPDGKIVLVGHHQGYVRAVDLTTRMTLWLAREHTLPVKAIAISSDGRTAITGGLDGRMLAWDITTGRRVHRMKAGRIFALAATPDGTRIVASGGDGNVSRLWDLERPLRLRHWPTMMAWLPHEDDGMLDTETAIVRAEWFAQNDRFDWAQLLLSRASQEPPHDEAEVRLTLSAAQAHWMIGDNNGAAELFSRLRDRHPPELQLYLALCSFAAGREAGQ
jgi:serine/threonine protein kinase/WD40 repeat protein